MSAALQILSKNFTAMATEADDTEANPQAILAEWQALEADVALAVNDIKTAVTDAGSANFTAVVSDLDDAIVEWAAAYKQAGDLHLELNVNNAQLEVGMSQAAGSGRDRLQLRRWTSSPTTTRCRMLRSSGSRRTRCRGCSLDV